MKYKVFVGDREVLDTDDREQADQKFNLCWFGSRKGMGSYAEQDIALTENGTEIKKRIY